MPVLVTPLFWEWFNIWLIQFLKNLYHEIKMVALRGGNSSLGTVSHGCGIHAGQQNALDLTHRLQTSLGMQHSASTQAVGHHASHLNHANHASHNNHINHANHAGPGSQLNIPSLSSMSLLMQQQTPATLKHEQNTRYSNSNCMLPSHHYRLLAQTRPECYHPSGAASGAYMSGATGGQSSAQSMRGQPAPQPSAPPAPQQDISKTTMAGPSYVSPQNQTPPSRPQYPNFQYRATQHGNRPSSHPRQQQPYMSGASASAAGPVMYHPTLMFPPHMGIPQTYQQPRSSTPGFYSYVPQYISYTTPTGPTTPYYYPSNGQQLAAGSVGGAGGRANSAALVPQQPNAPTASNALPHSQPQPHIHPSIPGIRQVPPKRTSHRLAIINPLTKQDIFSEIHSNDSQYMSGESSERQTPQLEQPHNFAEEFSRMVNEAANQPSPCESASKSNFVSKNVEVPVTTASSNPPHTNAISTINNNIVKSEILNVNENKSLGNEIVESNETPVVSAISDSPVVVPKMPINIKQIQKNMEMIQPLAVDNNKSLPSNKQQKQNKSKPVVPQDELEKQSDSVSSIVPQAMIMQTVVTAVPVPVTAALPATAPATTATSTLVSSSSSLAHSMPAPQPQRIREPRERVRSEDKEKPPPPKIKDVIEKEIPKPNGPTSVEISSVDSLLDAINPSTSQVTQNLVKETTKAAKPLSVTNETELSNIDNNPEVVINREPTFPVKTSPTATELLSASIEKVAKEQPLPEETPVKKEESIAIQAQVKLTQSIASVARNHPESKMKDINLNNNTTAIILDPDTANGNPSEVNKVETVKDEGNKNEKAIKNSKNNNKKSNKMASNEVNINKTESYENGKDETDKVSTEPEKLSKEEEEENSPEVEKPTPAPASSEPTVFVPKYKYSEDQWSPLNKSGKKYYDIGLLMQIKDDPLSKNKPNVPLLESLNVMRSPIQETVTFNPISRPMNDALFPNFLKNSGVGSRSNAPREPKKDGRIMPQSGKGSVKLTPSSSGSSSHKPVIHVSLSLREEVKLNQTKDAWRPTRFKKDNLTEEEFKTQDLYKKFRGILNKLTPQKFDTLLDKVKTLEINTQARLEGVIDLVFEKAIDEPNFSEAYAAMCSKLSMLKVPADNAPDQCVNFRALIISKCQNQFITNKVDENVLKLEKELAECTDPAKKKELHLQLEEENRRVRMRSVGNVRFIGELYKLKMLTAKIMVYCMTYLIEKLEEEKLECLCKLLTTIGEQVESEVKEQLESVFKKMQDIVERKSNKISSRVRFMLQDVIELRRRKWVAKNVVDSQPKMMDQIQKEAEQHQRHIELMNAPSMGGGGFRREDGGRGKRGGDRRQGSNSFMDNQWKPTRPTNYTVDTSKLKTVAQKNLSNIKLAPQNSGWNHGSGTKTPAQINSNLMISLTKNMYSVLENVQADPTSLRTNKDLSSSYHHSKSIERSTFNSRGDFNSGSGSRSGSVGVTRSNSSSRSATTAPAPAPVSEAAPVAPAPQEPLPDAKKKFVKILIMDKLVNPNDDEFITEIKQTFPPQYHAAVVTEILNIALERAAKDVYSIAKSLFHLVSTGTISSDNFLAGINEILEFAPDLYIDIPILYEYLGKFIAPNIEKRHITFVQVFRLCENIIMSNQGHMFLKTVIRDLKESMGPSFVKTKWQESGLELKQWMPEEQVPKWIEDNKFEFLEGGKPTEETKKILTPSETQSKLLQLMNTDEHCDCIRGWVQDNLGAASNENWFMRALTQAVCEYALYGTEGRDVPHFSHERMNKYASLISEFGDSREQREASCLFGIQQLIHRLEHPQGLTLEIFQYLHEQYIISVEGFIAWEVSEKEPEGKAVMLKALTSFFTNIKEADNEESCGED
ncbi:eukaryotic translation initiation factor 4 gamma 3-like isoform X1 [Vanessa cardui]|uniref:eukaryotic translation initiation factor 4 gamma 3-like isoform X1 n=1 Tax=Vanessa cardui TaxID=171605 RepID=UPI001F145D29|nr:eukaryotic translation initiation factor 4 gamma 3-like isoform X1 [Vanessa cardui]